MQKIIFFLFSFLSITSYAQTFEWVNIAGGPFGDYGSGVIVDNNHNVIATGTHFDSGTFGSTNVNTFGYQDAYIAKYDSLGNLLWVHGIGGSDQDFGYAVTVDFNNNIFLTGTFYKFNLHFTLSDSLIISGTNHNDSFIAKYDPNGNFLWARSGECTNSKSSSITTDNSGNAIISGFYNSTINFSNTILNGGLSNLFYVKYSPSGNLIWAKSGNSNSLCQTNALKCDNYGNIYATGKISTDVIFGSNLYVNMGGDDMYTCKFDSSGTIQWLQLEGNSLVASTTTNNFESGNGLDVDNAGNVYVVGSLLDTFIVATFYQSMAIVKYENNGTKDWLYKFGSNSIDVCNSLSLDSIGNPVVIGTYFGAMSLGTYILPTATDADIFVAKFDPNGNCIDAIGVGTGNGNDGGNGIFIDRNGGSIYLTGSMKNTLNFGTISVVGDFVSTIFIAKLNSAALSLIPINEFPINLSIFPNPTADIVNIKYENDDNYLVSLFSPDGQLIVEEESNHFDQIDLSALQTGLYFISFVDEFGNKTTLKIIKH